MFKKLVILFLMIFSSVAARRTADLLTVGSGINNVRRPNSRSAEFRIEYKSHVEWWLFRPMLGFMATVKGATYLYGGIGLDLYISNRWVFSPNFAAGYYQRGGGKDLGFPLEFRSGIELAYRFKELSRVGAHFYHMSNASIGRKNPGLESLVFFVSFPIGYSK